jgi:hypothetical protein
MAVPARKLTTRNKSGRRPVKTKDVTGTADVIADREKVERRKKKAAHMTTRARKT